MAILGKEIPNTSNRNMIGCNMSSEYYDTMRYCLACQWQPTAPSMNILQILLILLWFTTKGRVMTPCVRSNIFHHQHSSRFQLVLLRENWPGSVFNGGLWPDCAQIASLYCPNTSAPELRLPSWETWAPLFNQFKNNIWIINVTKTAKEGWMQ